MCFWGLALGWVGSMALARQDFRVECCTWVHISLGLKSVFQSGVSPHGAYFHRDYPSYAECLGVKVVF